MLNSNQNRISSLVGLCVALGGALMAFEYGHPELLPDKIEFIAEGSEEEEKIETIIIFKEEKVPELKKPKTKPKPQPDPKPKQIFKQVSNDFDPDDLPDMFPDEEGIDTAEATPEWISGPVNRPDVWPYSCNCEEVPVEVRSQCTSINLRSYYKQNARYPIMAKDLGIEGEVEVHFVIDRDGSIGDTRIGKSVHPILDREAIRVVKSFPCFKPGYMGTKPVPVNYKAKIVFNLID